MFLNSGLGENSAARLRTASNNCSARGSPTGVTRGAEGAVGSIGGSVASYGSRLTIEDCCLSNTYCGANSDPQPSLGGIIAFRATRDSEDAALPALGTQFTMKSTPLLDGSTSIGAEQVSRGGAIWASTDRFDYQRRVVNEFGFGPAPGSQTSVHPASAPLHRAS